MSLEIDIREPKVLRYIFNQPFLFLDQKEKVVCFAPHLTSGVKNVELKPYSGAVHEIVEKLIVRVANCSSSL